MRNRPTTAKPNDKQTLHCTDLLETCTLAQTPHPGALAASVLARTCSIFAQQHCAFLCSTLQSATNHVGLPARVQETCEEFIRKHKHWHKGPTNSKRWTKCNEMKVKSHKNLCSEGTPKPIQARFGWC